MKNLFGDNRQANILSVLRKNSALNIEMLAQRFGVSERTVRNDIKDINRELKNSGLVEINQGKCSLRVFDTRDFQNAYARIIETDDLMNSSQKRQEYVFAKLMRAMEPVLTDDIAYEMNIGRSTLISDLKKLRQTMEKYELEIVGKTSKGLALGGSELNIRKFVMENLFGSIYQNYPQDELMLGKIHEAMAEKNFEESTQKMFENYMTLMFDRFLTGHVITRMPEKYYNLVSRNSFSFVDELIDDISKEFYIEIPIEEKIFVFLPIIGMRTPADSKNMYSIELDEKIRPLLQKIVEQIRQVVDSSSQLDILSPSEAVSGILDQYDIVICTTEHIIECECPVIYIHEIFDENELKNKLRQAKFCKGTDAAILDDNWYVMANILKEDTFFNLSEQEDYTSALNYMIDTLEKRGYVDADFKERVWEKESRSSMTIDNIAIPHAVQKAGDSIVLSVGVFRKPMPYKEDNIQIIFLLALPEEIRDENRLVCVYDEIMSLVKNDEMIEKITQSENYIDFMKVLYKRN